VRDTGIGIPQADLKRIFQPFTQADSSSSHRIEGTGLGLTICARLIAMMHGHIRVESMPGQGSNVLKSVLSHYRPGYEPGQER
jgi:signal transduction histidine kinase